MKKAVIILVAFCFAVNIYGQNNNVKNLVNQGIALHDEGNFKAAIEKYQKALSIEPKNSWANYELSYTYFAMQDYDNAIKFSELSIKYDKNATAYIVLGNSLDLKGNTAKALKIYKKALKQFPNEYMLNYNFALTCFNQKKYDDAQKAAVNAITNNPKHASSHLILSSIMQVKGEKIKSLLPLYYFLMLEPNSQRSEKSYNTLNNILYSGVEKKDDKNITILQGTKQSKN
ncbi:MAG: tetratricopeptide repeat protein [Prevotellaceae bacterium]|nr:tetratricopeptide repeat protein [Prevotellaceae bacterium]